MVTGIIRSYLVVTLAKNCRKQFTKCKKITIDINIYLHGTCLKLTVLYVYTCGQDKKKRGDE